MKILIEQLDDGTVKVKWDIDPFDPIRKLPMIAQHIMNLSISLDLAWAKGDKD